jgi:transcriptional regulator with XRE-family HTH domain
MAERPVFHPELGAYFVRLREAKGWGQRQAAQIADKRKLSAINHQVLLRLEHGRVRHPDADVLRQVAKLYGEPYEDIAYRWFAAEYGVTREMTPEQVAVSIAREREREAQDDEEYGWLLKWRALAPQGRKLAVKQVDLLVEEFSAAGARPPQKAARRNAAS